LGTSSWSANAKPFAVVTRGSDGIGPELAPGFIANASDVLIASEDASGMAEAAQILASDRATVEQHATELATEHGVASVYDAVQRIGRPVDLLAVNAGVGLGGAFPKTDLIGELRMIDLNVRGAVQLNKLVLKDMVERYAGSILFTSSVAATMPDLFEAVYSAIKTFLHSFREALRNELKDTSVGLTVLTPGVTDTKYFYRAETDDARRCIPEQGRPRRRREGGGFRSGQAQGAANHQEQGYRRNHRRASGNDRCAT
jgi:short-subunit dehydrogenase